MTTEAKKDQVYKGELVEGMVTFARAEGVEITKKQADTALNGLIETMKNALGEGRRINFIGFGSLEVRHRPARESWDMLQEKMVELKAKNYVYFNTGSELSDKVENVPFRFLEKKNGKGKWVIDNA